MSLRWRGSILLLLGMPLGGVAQQVSLDSSAGHDAQRVVSSEGVAALRESVAEATLKLVKADGSQRGEVWLVVSAEASGANGARLTLKVPLSSTEDAYGESRACSVNKDGAREFTFTAGLDERNFVGFRAAGSDKQIKLLMNRYLCRALAAPFDCDGKKVELPEDWSRWRIGKSAEVSISSALPATLDLGMLALIPAKAFNPASCPVIAPSNGVCCVGGKTTNWHCGGRPVGAGWKQVSGDCWHQETGGSCKD